LHTVAYVNGDLHHTSITLRSNIGLLFCYERARRAELCLSCRRNARRQTSRIGWLTRNYCPRHSQS
jgi:hypothetical protein